MDRIVISGQGYPMTNEWHAFLEGIAVNQITGLVKAIGNNVIVSGMTNTGGTIADGWLIHNNELLPFQSGALDTTIVIVETVTSAGYDTAEDDSFDEVLPVWKTRVAKFGDPGDEGVVGSFSYSILTRIESLKNLLSKLSFKKSGQVTITYSDGTPQNAVATGDFIGAEILAGASSNTFTRVRLTFEAITGDYEALMNFDTSEGGYNGILNLSVYEKTSTSITVDIKRANILNYSGFLNKLNVKLIG